MLDRIIGSDIEVTLELHRSAANVRGDPDQFEQMIMNLATNARDAMESGGTLRIVVAPERLDDLGARRAGIPSGEYVRIEVSDTGSGMDEDTQRKCFEPLFTTKGPSHGTGVGLPAARRVVTESGGSIICRSVLGDGTTFVIHLPAVWEYAPTTVEPPRDDEVLETATVLLAEDEDGRRTLMSRVLSHRGFEVLEAASESRTRDRARVSWSDRAPRQRRHHAGYVWSSSWPSSCSRIDPSCSSCSRRATLTQPCSKGSPSTLLSSSPSRSNPAS